MGGIMAGIYNATRANLTYGKTLIDLLEDKQTQYNKGTKAIRQYCGFLEGGLL